MNKNNSKIALVALGGNSLIADSSKISFADQLATVRATIRNLAELIKSDYRLVITHGNGPQVGFILLRSHLARNRLPEIPLDCANAQTQAEIGFMIQLAIKNELAQLNINRQVVTVVTQVVVDKNDPSFQNPTKPIGPFYTKREAAILEKEWGWVCKEDAGRGFRRCVASPEPKAIVEAEAICNLVHSGAIVIAAGGGGIPVIQTNGQLSGVPAVIDKDLASSLLATTLNAELFLISTSVPNVYRNYNRPDATPISEMNLAEAKALLASGQFPAGSMGPKIEAAIRFLDKGGKLVIITSPTKIASALKGESGTRIVR
ncbi:MAG: carbamate kinase [candidate division WOR-3 bacterium]